MGPGASGFRRNAAWSPDQRRVADRPVRVLTLGWRVRGQHNTAETKAMLPVVEAFKTVYGLKDVTVVAEAGMGFDDNKKAIESVGLSFVWGEKIPQIPHQLQT